MREWGKKKNGVPSGGKGWRSRKGTRAVVVDRDLYAGVMGNWVVGEREGVTLMYKVVLLVLHIVKSLTFKSFSSCHVR